MRTPRFTAWALTALALLGCSGDGRTPTQPTIDDPTAASYVINDGAHGGGTPGFYFLPPLGNVTHFSGTPDRTLSPRAEVCELSGASCGAVVASFVSGPGATNIREAAGLYSTVWTTTAGLDPAKFYRLSVFVGTTRLGYVDIDVVASVRDLRTVNYAQYDALVRGLPFPIVFRIEQGIAGAVTVTPSTAGIAVGGTQQLTATVQDLHGNTMSSAAVTWSSADPTVATVSASGLVTAVAPGSTTISATSGTASGSAAVTVTPANHPPAAANDAYTAVEGVALTVAAPGVLGNDSDPDGNPLTAVLVTAPAHGTFALAADGGFTYTAATGFSGSDSFTYSASDGSLSSPPATVTLTVAAANHPPVAGNDAYAATEDVVLSVAAPGVLGNDSDPDGNTVTALAASITTPHGAVELHADGSFTYTPAANYHGTDSFTYQATDGSLSSASATVTLTVASVNDAPTAVADAYSAQEDVPLVVPAPGVLGNDSDVDGDAITAVAGTITTAHGGTVVMSASGGFTYTGAANYNGTDSFHYQVTDGTLTSTATVTLAVAAVNDPPVAVADSYQSIGNVTIHVPAPGLLANDTDVEGDPLTATPGTWATAAGGRVTVNADGSFSYVSAPGYTGGDSFTYTASDGAATSAPATVSITMTSRVWYVRNDAAAPGDGRDVSPFATLQGAQAASAPNDTIFVLAGTGTTAGLDQGIVLKAGQSLTGQGIPAPITTVLNGQTVTLLAPGAAPVLTNGPAPATIALATGNTVRGLDVRALNGAAISGASFGGVTAVNLSATATGGPALVLHGGQVNAAFTTLSSIGSSSVGLDLANLTGTLSAAGGHLSGSAQVAASITGGTANVTYHGEILSSTSRSVLVAGRAGGAVVFSDTVSGAGITVQSSGGAVQFTGPRVVASSGGADAITLAGNSGSVDFTGGGLDVETTTGNGIVASGGGTLSVTGAGNSIQAAGGTALSVQNTTIAAAGLTFAGISATGGQTGIVLVSTGSAGGLTVGGGTISGMTGADGTTAGTGVYLSSTSNVSLANVTLHDFSNYAIHGVGVSGFTLTGGTISGVNGTSAATHDGGIVLTELSGQALISGTSVSGGYLNNLRVENTTASLDRLTIQNSTFGANDAANGADGVVLLAAGAPLNVTVQNSQFTAARQQLLDVDVQGTAHADVVLAGNTFSNNHPSIIAGAGGVLFTVSGASAGITYTVTGNSFRDALGSAFSVFKGAGTASASGTIANNVVGVAGIPNSGSAQGSALSLVSVGGGSQRVAVTGNQLYQYNNRGVLLQVGDASQGGDGQFDATVTGNTIANPGTASSAKNGVLLTVGTASGDAPQACVALSGNTVAGSGSGGGAGADVRFNERFLSAVRLPGYTGAANDNAAVQAFLLANNAGSPTAVISNNVAAGGSGYVGGAGCSTP